MKKTSSIRGMTSIFENGQMNKAIIDDINCNTNKITIEFPFQNHSPSLMVNSDEENYIHRQHQYSIFNVPKNSTNENSINNNIDSTLDIDDIRGHLWYHGSIGRSQAEALVNSGHNLELSGQFLVRDCISRAGNYVLTCHWKGEILHFMINRTLINNSRAQYHFEDEPYQSVPDLIRAYVGQKKSITEESQCIISKPINRSPIDSPRSNSINTLRQTVSEKSILIKHVIDQKSINLDNDREQGNYVRMRTRLITSKSPNRESISANGIDNLKIPKVPDSIRNRPLPPIPPVSTSIQIPAINSAIQVPANNLGPAPIQIPANPPIQISAGNLSRTVSSKPLTLRDKVMLKEARRHQLNKWRSESALEDHENGNKSIICQNIDIEKIDPQIHGSTSLQSLNRPNKQIEPPAKPKKAPSLKNPEKHAVVIKDAETGEFQELSGIELNHIEDDEECDYHEYCDIDYEQLSDQKRRSLTNQIGKVKDFPHENKSSPAFQNPPHKPPALPPRVKTAIQIQDRDSACVPDIVLYDLPNELCKAIKSKNERSDFIGHYDILKRPQPTDISTIKYGIYESPLLPSDTKPLDSRIWPRVRDIMLNTNTRILAMAATKEDMNNLNREIKHDFIHLSRHSNLILPQGKELRGQILDRYTCLKFFVTSTLLQNESNEISVQILAKWIDLANTALDECGNEFLFMSIMEVLISPLISDITVFWNHLFERFPIQAKIFDTVLRSQFSAIKRFQNGVIQDEINSKYILPYMEPIIRLLEINSVQEMILFDGFWEENEDDVYQLDSFWHLLQETRYLPKKLLSYSKFETLSHEPDRSIIRDIFSTQFQLRYLFGNRGCTVTAAERYSTFQKILDAMALNIKEKYKE